MLESVEGRKPFNGKIDKAILDQLQQLLDFEQGAFDSEYPIPANQLSGERTRRRHSFSTPARFDTFWYWSVGS